MSTAKVISHWGMRWNDTARTVLHAHGNGGNQMGQPLEARSSNWTSNSLATFSQTELFQLCVTDTAKGSGPPVKAVLPV